MLSTVYSLCDDKYKIGMIKGLFHRVWMVNSKYSTACADIENVVQVLSKNGYRREKLERHAAHVVKRLYCNSNNEDKNYDTDRRISLVVPYSNGFSKLKNVFSKLSMHDVHESYKINVISRSFKISQMFPVKSKTPIGLQANLVYKFECHGCNAQYIGETCRHLRTRFAEHNQMSRKSHILDHNLICKKRNMKLSLNEFSILNKNFKSSYERTTYEALSIMSKKPVLNVQNDFSDRIKIFCIVGS